MNIQEQANRKRLALLKQKERLEKGLPHLYGWPWYQWAKDFFETRNRLAFVCAGNQLSKSSTQIRKIIHWATEPSLWPELWTTEPAQYWYLYPSKQTATFEFKMKWIKEFLPRGEYKNHPQYGWKADYEGKWIQSVTFNSGVTVYFKTYAQDVHTSLQAGTVHYLACDEELPWELFPELSMRGEAVQGHMSFAFTATMGQPELKKIIEGDHLPSAFKRQVSAYDCLNYADGSPSPWTVERIEKIKERLSTKREILKRIYGKFVVADGLKYEAFTKENNFKPAHPVPQDWLIYAGIDYGSGSRSGGHPSAICFVAVKPDYSKARVVKCKRFDDHPTTTGDLIQLYVDEAREFKQVTQIFYDWSCADLAEYGERAGLPMEKAQKDHIIGENILNTLFKCGGLVIYEDKTGESLKLVTELETLLNTTNKKRAKDDAIDALRYIVASLAWNLPVDMGPSEAKKIEKPKHYRGDFIPSEEIEGYDSEIEFWNELYEC